MTAIRGDAAIKDEPGAVNQPLLAPLRAMDLDRRSDTSVSDGGGRQTKRTKKTLRIMSGMPITHLSSISDAVIAIKQVLCHDSVLH